MSKPNYGRSAGSSLVPRSSALSESERQETLIKRIGKGAYYANKAHRGGVWAEQLPRMSPEEIEKQKAHSRRADLIAEIAGRKV
jgi:hypothetical protein